MASPAAVLRIFVDANTAPAERKLRHMNTALNQSQKAAHSFSHAVDIAGIATAGLAVYGLAKAVSAGVKFERQMSSLGAVSGASAGQMKKLENQALKLGESTIFTARNVAEAQTELAKGGLKTAQILGGGTKAALSLAAAGQLELAEAAETTVNAMKLFGVSAKHSEAIADGFATAANKTTGDVTDFAESMKQGGAVAKLAGYSFNNTLAILESLAEAGVKGSDAGTSLKTSLSQLIKPSTKQSTLMAELGFHIETANGELKRGAGLSKELTRVTEGMTKAERAHVFAVLGGTDGIRTLNALYDEGPGKIRKLERANKKQGTAQEVANKQMHNFQGELEQLQGAAETLGIRIFKVMKPALQSTVHWASMLTEEVSAIFADKNLSGPEKFKKSFNLVFSKLVPLFEKTLTNLSEVAAENAPKAALAFVKGWLNAGIWGKLFSAAYLFGKFPAAMGAFGSLGAKAASSFSSSFATTAASESTYELARSFGRGRFSSALAQGGSLAMAGSTAAKTLVGGLARQLGPALAAIGVANVATSAMNKDWGDAGFEAGGAIAGGLAGFMLGGPMGAMLGAGLGSLGGELGSKLFGGLFGATKKLAPLQQRLQASSVNVKKAFAAQRDAAGGLATAHRNLRTAEKHQTTATEGVHSAERRLSQDRKKYGADSNRVRHDEVLLAKAKHRDAEATKEVSQAHQLDGASLKLYRHLTVEATASSKSRIADLQEEAQKLYKKWQADKSNNELAKRASKAYSELGKEQKNLNNLYQEAGAKAGPKYQHMLEHLSREQAAFGTKYRGIGKAATEVKGKIEDFSRSGIGAFGNFSRKTKVDAEIFREKTKSISEATGIAATKIETRLASALEKMGISGHGFGVSANGVPSHQEPGRLHRQRGGPINLGAPSGDSVPAMLEKGEYVLNRKAAAAVGKKQLDAINFGAAPRFQKGGAIAEPQITGPSGALRDLGQGAVHSIFEGAKNYLKKHASHGRGGPVEAEIARVLFGSGFNKIAAAGVIGNAFRESRLDPSAVGTGGGGLFGFTSGAISLAALQSAAQRANTPWDNPAFQVGFMLRHGGLSLRPKLNVASSAAEAAAIFMNDWERPGIPAQGERESAARRAYSRGYQKGGFVEGNPFDPSVMRGAPTAAPLMRAGEKGYLPKTIGRIKNKALSIADAFTGYVWGGGHSEGTHVTADGLDCSGAVAKLVQESGWKDFAVAVSSDYASRFMPGKGDLFTIWSNAEHTFAEIEGKTWGTNTSNGLGYATHTTTGFTPRHPKLANETKTQESSHSYKENVPATWGGLRTKAPSFPSIPKNLEGVEKELKLRRKETKAYKAGIKKAQGKNRPGVVQALQHVLTSLEKRISELERARHKLRIEKAKKKITAGLHKQLGKLTGFSNPIAYAERAFNAAQQYATQVVELEPDEEKGAGALIRYINEKETPVYADLLAKAFNWRDVILGAERKAAGQWEKTGPLGGLEGRWEDTIISTSRQIDQSEALIKKARDDRANFEAAHPKAAFPKWLQKENKAAKEAKEQLPLLSFKEREVRKILGEGRSEFYPGGARITQNPKPPIAGSGQLEEALEGVQGLHWPGEHGPSPRPLPEKRMAGKFGGSIWDVQQQIEELGLKVRGALSNAFGSLSSGSEGTESSARAERLEEKLREANQSRLVYERQAPILERFAGYHAKGGFIPTGMWGIAGEAGPEIVHGPARVYSNSDSAAMGNFKVEVHNYSDRTAVLVNGMEATAARVYDHKSRAGGRAAKTIGSRVAGKGI